MAYIDGIVNLSPTSKIRQSDIVNHVTSVDKYRQMALNGLEDTNGEVHKMQVAKGNNAKLIDSLLVDSHKFIPFDPAKHSKDSVLSMSFLDNKGDRVITHNMKRVCEWNDSRWAKWNAMRHDASYFFHPYEVEVLQKQIQPYLRWGEPMPIVPGFWNEEDIGRGMQKYTYFKTDNVTPPDGSYDFEQYKGTKVTVQSSTVELYGLFYDFHLSMVQKDASMSGNPLYRLTPNKEQFIIQELTKALATYQQGYKYRGTSYYGLQDIGITGLVNDSGVTAQTTIGNAGSLIAYGNIRTAATTLANGLINNKIFPPFILDLSPGVTMQANKNQDVANGMMFSELQGLFSLNALDGSKMFSGIRMNPHMINASAEGNTTASMAVFKPAMENISPFFKYVTNYPLSYYPLPPTTLGVDGKILFMGRTILEQPNAVAYGNTLTVNVF